MQGLNSKREGLVGSKKMVIRGETKGNIQTCEMDKTLTRESYRDLNGGM